MLIKGQKNIIFLIIIAEAGLIVILALGGFKKSKDNINLRLQLKTKEEELVNREALIKDLEKQVIQMKAAQAELEGRAKELTEATNVLEGKLTGSKEATEILAKQFGNQEKDIFERFSNLTTENKKTFAILLNKIDQLMGAKGILEKRIRSLQSERDSADQSTENPEEITLDKISVKNKASYPENVLGLNSAGNVLDVDNEYNFVIINLGQENGVKPGSKFAVIRNKKKIGELVLKEIYKGMSLGEPIAEKTLYRFRRGDQLLPIR